MKTPKNEISNSQYHHIYCHQKSSILVIIYCTLSTKGFQHPSWKSLVSVSASHSRRTALSNMASMRRRIRQTKKNNQSIFNKKDPILISTNKYLRITDLLSSIINNKIYDPILYMSFQDLSRPGAWEVPGSSVRCTPPNSPPSPVFWGCYSSFDATDQRAALVRDMSTQQWHEFIHPSTAENKPSLPSSRGERNLIKLTSL